jgi:hypothetical protein
MHDRLTFFFLHKWAGKTIALGTFPAAEADEKCARAKALTRAWRSTMRPKPSREWVMLELERLNVRVVSGRLGRKDEDGGEEGGGQGKDHYACLVIIIFTIVFQSLTKLVVLCRTQPQQPLVTGKQASAGLHLMTLTP